MPSKGSKLTQKQKDNISIGTIKGIKKHKFKKVCPMCNCNFLSRSINKLYCGDLKRKTGCTYTRRDTMLSRDPIVQKNWKLKWKFGIDLNEYNRILGEQNGVCAICGKLNNRLRKNGKIFDLDVDHCHITGKVRGLLCNRCNKGMGDFNDNVELLKRAINYLEKYI